MYLFLDPGGTTGYALFHPTGEVKTFDQIKGLDSFADFLIITHERTPLQKIFSEQYILDNDKIFRDKDGKKRRSELSDNEKKGHQDTLEVIGATKFFCRQNNISFTEILKTTLKASLAHAGLRMPKDHSISHELVAYAYGTSYFIKAGITKVKRRPL